MLTSKHRLLLRKILHSEKYYYSSKEESEVLYFQSLKYVTVSREGDDSWGNGGVSFCQVTEAGKAYLYETKVTFLRFTIPVTISLCSLIVSILAILVSLRPEILERMLVLWLIK